MIYEVENMPKRLSFEFLDRAVLFGMNFLGLDQNIVIQFETLPKFQCGFCDYDEDEIILTLARRLSRREAIVTLFHEMVHVKQHADGRLVNGTHWCGIDFGNVSYIDLPWEQEARRLEQVMLEMFERQECET